MEKIICQGTYQYSELEVPFNRIRAMAVRPIITESFRDEENWVVSGKVEIVIEGDYPQEKLDEIDDSEGLFPEEEIEPFLGSIEIASNWQTSIPVLNRDTDPEVKVELRSHEAWQGPEGIEWKVELELAYNWPENKVLEQVTAPESEPEPVPEPVDVESLTEAAPWLKEWVEVKPCSAPVSVASPEPELQPFAEPAPAPVEKPIKEIKTAFIIKKENATPANLGKGRRKITMYFVKTGDSWETIASQYGVGVEILRQHNPGSELTAGAVIWVPRG